ncbi:MAG: O-acetyltransferase NeuD family protein [Bryobacterales bacterium]|nr:O-acetyltransferase NeuD family protein [Bryobacterales bacterium]
MKELVIFGTGSFAELAHYYFQRGSSYSVAAFTPDAAFISETAFQELPVVAFENVETDFPPKTTICLSRWVFRRSTGSAPRRSLKRRQRDTSSPAS